MTPQHWRSTTLGELGRHYNGRGFKKVEWGTSGRPIIRIQNLTGSSNSFNYFDGAVDERNIARSGDLLISWAATLGAFIWQGPEAAVNQHIFKVESFIDTRFHKYLLDFKLADLARSTHGSGIVHVTRSKFDSIPVSVPSLDEQRRIVEILERHLSRLDAAAHNQDSAARRLSAWWWSSTERLLRSAGESTVRIGDVLREPMRNGRSDRAVESGQPGTRCVTLTAVTRRDFSERHTKVTVTSDAVAAGLWLRDGDVLVQRSNTPELVGSAARYVGPSDWAIFPDLLIRLRPDETRLRSDFLELALQLPSIHRTLRARAKGLAGSMPKIDQRAIAQTSVPLPSLDVQAALVRSRDELAVQRASLEGAITRSEKRSSGLRRALLAAAFSGQLTGRDSDLERAEELVEA